MGAVTKQANFTLPGDLLAEFKRAVPKGQQSRVVAEALRHELKRIKFRTALEGSFGAWQMDRHPELTGGTRRFVRALRKSSRLKRIATT